MRFDSEYRHNLNKPIVMKYCFDIDGTLCVTPSDPDGHNVRYWDAELFLLWLIKSIVFMMKVIRLF